MPAGPGGNLPPAGPALPSLNSAPYRVMLGIPETLECQEPQGGQDCQGSLEFGALWGQKEKRLVRWGGWGQGSLLHKKSGGAPVREGLQGQLGP